MSNAKCWIEAAVRDQLLDMRTLGLVLACLLGGAAPAAADSLPLCPPGQHMVCNPSQYHHGCGGCAPDDPTAEVDAPSADPPEAEPAPEPATEPVAEPAPAETTAAPSAERESSGGCAATPGGHGSAPLALLALLALVVRRQR
ncbi:MAG: hypothetical protein H6719_20050 [Sandaracinaceae bacterium]|nr:hypothetical protein [Sandaracinaceae bacterium]